jgi:hypothetical protein
MFVDFPPRQQLPPQAKSRSPSRIQIKENYMTSTCVSPKPTGFSPISRAAEIKRLSDQANTIGALLSAIHILEECRQNEALLDCSSSADDFARDLDAFVGGAGMSSGTAQNMNLVADANSERWIPISAGRMPPEELAVIGWDSAIGKPCAVFFDFDPGINSWISQFDPTTIYEGEITHWRYCDGPDGIGREGDAP